MSHSALPPFDPATPTLQDAVPVFQVPGPPSGATGITTNSTNVSAVPAPSPVAVIETEAKQLMSPAGRLWLYGVCVAALPLLVAFGKVSGDQVSLWTDFAASILGVSGLTVAIANVKK